ncbi:MAG: HAMP domain-containing sensor histidine kinase [Gelidibacter sp.]
MSKDFEILDAITDSMAIINTLGEIIFTNKAWLAFSDENIGNDSCTGSNNNYLSVCDSVQGDELKSAKDAQRGIQNVIDKKEKIFELEYPCHSPTEKRWFILRASQVLSNPDLTLLAHINITNRKIAELEIEKNYNKSLILNDLVSTTLYKIVHDIQDPLSGIIGLINLSKSESDIETLNEYLELMEVGSSNLSAFVRETLTYISRSEESQKIIFEDMLSKYLETVTPLLKSNGINMTLDIQQKGEFRTNAIEFRSILSNLISNSIKYCDEMKHEKFIIIRFSSDSNRAILKVEDNGLGVKKEDIPKLMQRNYQVNKKSEAGVGLGLFMVAKSVTNLGGSIKIRSNYGIGSEFTVEIPNKI